MNKNSTSDSARSVLRLSKAASKLPLDAGNAAKGRDAARPVGKPLDGRRVAQGTRGIKPTADSPRAPKNVWRSADRDVAHKQITAKADSLSHEYARPVENSEHAAGGIRLNKRMADLGICSRREADAWIVRGWVFVNGEPSVVGQRVEEQDTIHVDKLAYTMQEQQVTILLHKPVGYVSSQPEDDHASAASLLGQHSRWRGDKSLMRFLPRQLRGLAPAGRLDIDSTGLLVLTQDGRIARQLIGAESAIDKEYLVRVSYTTPHGVVYEQVQAVLPAEKLELLRHGLSLDDVALKPAQVDWQNPEQLRFVLTEGRKRQIRRMCEAVGLQVTGLKRVRIGKVMLGDLPCGKWRFLRADETF